MLLNYSKIAILCLLAVSCLSVEARRRSRIDVPTTTNVSDTATEASIVTVMATEKLIEAEKLEATQQIPTTIQPDIDDDDKVSESNSSEESPAYEDCDLDNISFEMITG